MTTTIKLLSTIALACGLAAAASLSCKTEDPGAVPVDGYPGGCCGQAHTYSYCCGGWSGAESCAEPPDPAVCADAGFGTTGPIATDGHMVSDTNPMMTGADTGVDCGEYQLYTCRGWHAGVYHSSGTNYRFDFTLLGGEKYAGAEVIENFCIPSVGEADNEELYAACTTECENKDWTGFYPTNPTGFPTWTLDHVACVFGANSDYAIITGVVGDFYDSGKEWIPTSSTDPRSPQCLNGECLTPDMCPAQVGEVCTGWNPGAEITSSLSSKTYTTTVHASFLNALADDMFDKMYACDDGFWTWSTTANPDKWRMQDLTVDDILYKMGFRNYDEQLRIRRNIAGAPWYNLYASNALDGYSNMATAFGALQSYTSFKIELKRGTTTYTMNLTLN